MMSFVRRRFVYLFIIWHFVEHFVKLHNAKEKTKFTQFQWRWMKYKYARLIVRFEIFVANDNKTKSTSHIKLFLITYTKHKNDCLIEFLNGNGAKIELRIGYEAPSCRFLSSLFWKGGAKNRI